MADNINNINGFVENDKSEINKLKSEIEYLNNQILDKIQIISSGSHTSGDILDTIEDIITSQRQEISWKNKDLKELELKYIQLVKEMDNSGSINSNANDSQGDDDVVELKKKNIVLEKKIQIHKETIEILSAERSNEYWEAQINDLTQLISELEAENANLREESKPIVNNEEKESLERDVTFLKIRIDELEESNKKIDEKSRMLKAALLMTVNTETKNLADTPSDVNAGGIIEVETKDKTVSIQEGPSTVKTSEPEQEQSSKRRRCPECSAAGAFILEMDDKTNILYQDGGMKMYGKKFKCGDCRHEWK